MSPIPAAVPFDALAALAGPELSWGTGAMCREGVIAVCEDIIANTRRRVVELGSGVSTILLARFLTRQRQHVDWRQVAVEHDSGWARHVTDELDREGITRVTVVHARLTSHSLAKHDLCWYNEAALSRGLDLALGREPIDLLVVDGPPAYLPGFGLARFPALPALRHRLAPGATVLLHDVGRPGEQEVLRRWQEEVGLVFEHLPEPTGLAKATV